MKREKRFTALPGPGRAFREPASAAPATQGWGYFIILRCLTPIRTSSGRPDHFPDSQIGDNPQEVLYPGRTTLICIIFPYQLGDAPGILGGTNAGQ